MVTFIIVRHGFSRGNKENRFSGQMDVPLDETGILQARATAEYILANFKVDSVYASDLSRAVDTVKPIAEALGLPVHTCKELREVDVGNWQDRSNEEIAQLYPESLTVYRKTPGLAQFDGGESFAEAQQRSLEAIHRIAAENDGKTVVVGTHGGIVRALQVAWMGMSMAQMHEVPYVPNCAVTEVNYEKGKAEIVISGYADHLTEKTELVDLQ